MLPKQITVIKIKFNTSFSLRTLLRDFFGTGLFNVIDKLFIFIKATAKNVPKNILG